MNFFFNLHLVVRLFIGGVIAGLSEFLVMSEIKDVSSILDATIVSILFIFVVILVVIPEVKSKTKIQKANKALQLKHEKILQTITKQASLNINSIMFEHMDDAVLITDKNNNIITINPAFTELTGYHIDDVSGKNPSILKSDSTPIDVYQEMWSAINTEGKWEGILLDRKKDGTFYKKYLKIYTVKNEKNIVNYIGIFFNADKKDEENQKYLKLAMYDNLTGIANRNLFFDRVKTLFSQTRDKVISAIMFLDLDDFKNINDVYGHQYGDYVLQEVSRRISHCLRKSDTVARLGGDEFSVILHNIKSRLDAGSVAGKIIAEIEKPICTESFCFRVSCSIGIAISHDDGITQEEIIQNADLAMYKAKDLGKGQFEFFNHTLKESFVEKVTLENELYNAIKNNELLILFQPQIDSITEKVCGVEALVRWNRNGEVISPSLFISTAEKSKLIVDIDKHVFNMVVDYIEHQFKPLFKEIGYEFRVSVNVSASTLQYMFYDDFEYIQESLAKYENIANFLEFEITETTLMTCQKTSAKCIDKLHQIGISSSIDDFGTGHSSLSYINELNIDKIKIDRSFIVKASLENSKSKGLISFIKSLAESIGATTVAEGVETLSQKDMIVNSKIDSIQGFLYSKPIDINQLMDFIKNRNIQSTN